MAGEVEDRRDMALEVLRRTLTLFADPGVLDAICTAQSSELTLTPEQSSTLDQLHDIFYAAGLHRPRAASEAVPDDTTPAGRPVTRASARLAFSDPLEAGPSNPTPASKSSASRSTGRARASATGSPGPEAGGHGRSAGPAADAADDADGTGRARGKRAMQPTTAAREKRGKATKGSNARHQRDIDDLTKWEYQTYARIHALQQLPEPRYLYDIADAYDTVDPTVLLRHMAPHSRDFDVLANKMSSSDVLVLAYLHARDMEQVLEQASVDWCYSMLSIRDAVKHRFPIEERLSPRMQQTIIEQYRPIVNGSGSDTSVEEIFNNLNRWYKIGKKLEVFVNRFGAGCFFYLGPLLYSGDWKWVAEKAPVDGRAWDAMARHLNDDLGLRAHADANGANELGEAYRDLFRTPLAAV